MNKRQAKIEALNCAAALIENMDADQFVITRELDDNENDFFKVYDARHEIVKELRRRTVRLSGNG